MLIFRDISTVQNHLNNLKINGKIIGFVPTMGALHDGHLSLIKQSLQKTDFTVVSIFVNPTQFDSHEDFNTYPSDTEKDIDLLKSISDEIILFNPASAELYSNDLKLDTFDFNGLDKFMEGEYRGHHFHGVATIVNKLFSIIKADYAYFGEKDFQQLLLGVSTQYKFVNTFIGYRNEDALIYGCGLNFYRFKIQYSYDQIISKLSNAAMGSHEVGMIFRFGSKSGYEDGYYAF